MTTQEWAELIRAITLMISALGTVFGGLISVQIFNQRLELASLKQRVQSLQAANETMVTKITELNGVVIEYTGRLNTALDTLTTRNNELSAVHKELAQGVKGLNDLQVAVQDYITNDGGVAKMQKALDATKTNETKKDKP